MSKQFFSPGPHALMAVTHMLGLTNHTLSNAPFLQREH